MTARSHTRKRRNANRRRRRSYLARLAEIEANKPAPRRSGHQHWTWSKSLFLTPGVEELAEQARKYTRDR